MKLGFTAFISGLLISLVLSTAQALEVQGQATQGALLVGQSTPGARVFVGGQEVPVLPDGRVLIPLARSAPTTVVMQEVLPSGQTREFDLPVQQRSYRTERLSNLPAAKVSAPRSTIIQNRIDRELGEIADARAIYTRTPLFDSGFDWPLIGRITGVYGSQRVLNGKPGSPHYGIDIAGASGTTIKAPADGIVRLIQPDNFYSGGTLILDHGYGLNSAFLHMQAFNVDVGQQVKKGMVLGSVGSTGRSTGSHLDWRITYNGVRVDPVLVAGPMPGS